MSKRFAVPLWIDVKQSRYLLAFIIIVHILALLSSLLMPIDVMLKGILLLLLGYSFYFYSRRHQQGFYSFSLRQSAELSWELIEHNQHSYLRVLRSTVLTSFIGEFNPLAQVKDKKHSQTLNLSSKIDQLFIITGFC